MQVTNVTKKDQADPSKEERAEIAALIKGDKVAEAIRYSEQLALKYPYSFLLSYSTGMSYVLLSEHEQAVKNLERAIKLRPDAIEVHRHLGHCYLKMEMNDKARGAFERALAIAPGDEEANDGLIQAIIDPVNFEQSVAGLKKMVEADPDNLNLNLAFGRCNVEQENYNVAVRHFLKADELNPNDVPTMIMIGEAYVGFNKPIEALNWYHKALEKEAPRPGLMILMSIAYKDSGDFDKSVEYAEKAIELNPDGGAPESNLAHIYTILGEKEKAIDLHKKRLKDNAENTRSILGLANLEKVKENDESIKILEEIYAKEPRNVFDERSKTGLGFSLSKVYEDVGQYGQSMETLVRANTARNDFLKYDFAKEVEYFDLVKHVFAPITPEDYVDTATDADPNMIFILGMPRSGTTLTEQIISSHSQVYGAGELRFMTEETAELMYMFGLQPDVQLKKVAFEHIRRNYLGHIASLGAKEKTITDKMPHNFLRLGYVLCSFPEAKVIHLNRDPVAVCLSCYKKLFPAKGMGFTFNLRNLGLYYGLYLDLMDFWRKKFPGRILELDYEELTENQEKQTRMLLEHCDLPWEDQCLEFYKTKRGVLTASQTQVREKMYQGSSEQWKKFSPYLGELFDALDEAGVKYEKP